MKALTKIEAVLTVLLIAVLAANVSTIKLHALHNSNPAREAALHTGLGSVLNIACYAVTFCWVLFTAFYVLVVFTNLAAWFFRRLADNKNDNA